MSLSNLISMEKSNTNTFNENGDYSLLYIYNEYCENFAKINNSSKKKSLCFK